MQDFIVSRQVNNSFVNSHFISVKSRCSVAAWRFSGSYFYLSAISPHSYGRIAMRPYTPKGAILLVAEELTLRERTEVRVEIAYNV